MLATSSFGIGERLVLVHGFTQTKETWADLVAELKDDYQLLTVDAPNHGGSADIDLDLEHGARAIVDVGGSATYLGYSLGARLCLDAALAFPEAVRRLVLVSGTAGIEDAAQRSARLESDENLARQIERFGVEKFVDSWLAQPLFDGLNQDNNQRSIRLTNSARGLASSLRLCGAGNQRPSWSRLGELTIPVLVVAGVKDEKFARIAERIVGQIGNNASLCLIEGSGHTPHLEQPERFATTVREFLASTREQYSQT